MDTLKQAVARWSHAITVSDRHARTCKLCYRPIQMARVMGIDPYKDGGYCPTALRAP